VVQVMQVVPQVVQVTQVVQQVTLPFAKAPQAHLNV
jgi:hypothetical protein